MSMSAIIRAVAGGPQKTRAEGDKPEDTMEDDTAPEEVAEDMAPEEETEDMPAEEYAEDMDSEEDAEDDEEQPMAAANAALAAKARKAERARIGAIMGDPAADANPKLAAHLAFQTGMSTKAALAALKAGGETPAGGTLARRMAGASQPRLGGAASAKPADPQARRAAARQAYIDNLSNPRK